MMPRLIVDGCSIAGSKKHCLHITETARMTAPAWPWVYCCHCGKLWDAPPRGKHMHGGFEEIDSRIVRVKDLK